MSGSIPLPQCRSCFASNPPLTRQRWSLPIAIAPGPLPAGARVEIGDLDRSVPFRDR
jgi:hypothetical protein